MMRSTSDACPAAHSLPQNTCSSRAAYYQSNCIVVYAACSARFLHLRVVSMHAPQTNATNQGRPVSPLSVGKADLDLTPSTPAPAPGLPRALLFSSRSSTTSSPGSGDLTQKLQDLDLLQPDSYTKPCPGACLSSTVLLPEELPQAADKAPAPVQRSLNIVILAGGTRGDVQPALALGLQLAAAGHVVRLATDSAFKGFVEEHGLEHFPLGGDAKEMMALTVKWGGMLPTNLSGMLWLRTQIAAIMDSTWAAVTTSPAGSTRTGTIRSSNTSPCSSAASRSSSFTNTSSSGSTSSTTSTTSSSSSSSGYKPDLIIANQLAYGQVYCAEALGIPLHMIYTVPWLPTRQMPHSWARAFDQNITHYFTAAAAGPIRAIKHLVSLVNPAAAAKFDQHANSWVTGAANWLTTPLLDSTAFWGIADLVWRFRAKIGLPLLSRGSMGLGLYSVPTTCLWSPSLLPKPSDWPAHVTVAGFQPLQDSLQRATAAAGGGGCRQGAGAGGSMAGAPGTSYAVSSRTGSSSTGSWSMVSTPAACSPKAGLTATAANTSPVSCGSGNSRGGSTITPSLAAATLLLQQQQQQQQQQPSQWTPPANLAAFLSNGAPPVYIGFGSLVCAGDNTWLSQLVWEATQQLAGSCRVVVATGWGLMAGVSGHTWGDHVALVTEAPHDWLFPRCTALVHHGGVGTTATGLRYGLPTLVIPSFGDLFLWGDICHQLGVGPAPIPLKELTVASLVSGVKQLVGVEGYRQAAAKAAAALAQEDGLSAAVVSVLRQVT